MTWAIIFISLILIAMAIFASRRYEDGRDEWLGNNNWNEDQDDWL